MATLSWCEYRCGLARSVHSPYALRIISALSARGLLWCFAAVTASQQLKCFVHCCFAWILFCAFMCLSVHLRIGGVRSHSLDRDVLQTAAVSRENGRGMRRYMTRRERGTLRLCFNAVVGLLAAWIGLNLPCYGSPLPRAPFPIPVPLAMAFSWGGLESDCARRSYSASKAYCEGAAVSGRLVASLRSIADFNSKAGAVGCSNNARWYWVGAEWSNSANAYVWQDGSNAKVTVGWGGGEPDLRTSSAAVAYNQVVNAHEDVYMSFDGYSSTQYATSLCEIKMCAANDCHTAGTQTVQTSRRLSIGGCCSCKAKFTGAKCDTCVTGYFGTACDKQYCSNGPNPCNTAGTATFKGTNARPDCCTCKANVAGATCNACVTGRFPFPACDKEYCSNGPNPCNTAGTATFKGTNARPDCCTCKPNFAGATCAACASGYTALPLCADEFCRLRGNTCVASNTAAYLPDNVRPGGGGGGQGTVGCCRCLEQFAGNDCGERICHANHDCRGNAISVAAAGNAPRISGQYPNCVCRCAGGYGGRDCRTLTATPSATVVFTASFSLSTSISTTVSFSASSTASASVSPSPSASASQSSSLSGTVLSTVTVSLSASRTVSATATRVVTESVSYSVTTSGTSSETATVSISLSTSPSGTLSASASASYTLSASQTPSSSPSASASLPSPSASESFSCPAETWAEARLLPRTTDWNKDPDHLIVAVRPMRPVVRHTVSGDLLALGASLLHNPAGGGNTTNAYSLLLRSDVLWKGGILANVTGYLELLRGPDARWQPLGLRGRAGHRVGIDYNGTTGAVTAHIPLMGGFVVDEAEEAVVIVSAEALFGCGPGGLWLSLATLLIEPRRPDAAGRAAVEAATHVAALLSGATDLQSVAMIGLLPCSGGLTAQLASSRASLSPFAIGDEWIGVIGGNAAAAGAALAVCAVAVALVSWRHRRARRERWAAAGSPPPDGSAAALFADRTGLLAAAVLLRLPALPLKGLLFLYAGTLTAGLQSLIGGIGAARGSALFEPLTDEPSEASAVPSLGSAPAQISAGLAALIVVALGLPIGLALCSRRRVSRGFAAYDYSVSAVAPSWAVPKGSPPEGDDVSQVCTCSGPSRGALWAARLLLPCGAFVPADTAKMFGPVIGTSRHAPRGSSGAAGGGTGLLAAVRGSALWPTMPMWSCWIVAAGQLFLVRDVALCRGLMGAMAAAHFGLAALVLLVRPHAVALSWLLASVAYALTGAVLVASALLIGGAGSDAVRRFVVAAVAAQAAVGYLRIVHTCGLAVYAMARLWARRRSEEETANDSSQSGASSADALAIALAAFVDDDAAGGHASGAAVGGWIGAATVGQFRRFTRRAGEGGHAGGCWRGGIPPFLSVPWEGVWEEEPTHQHGVHVQQPNAAFSSGRSYSRSAAVNELGGDGGLEMALLSDPIVDATTTTTTTPLRRKRFVARPIPLLWWRDVDHPNRIVVGDLLPQPRDGVSAAAFKEATAADAEKEGDGAKPKRSFTSKTPAHTYGDAALRLAAMRFFFPSILRPRRAARSTATNKKEEGQQFVSLSGLDPNSLGDVDLFSVGAV